MTYTRYMQGEHTARVLYKSLISAVSCCRRQRHRARRRVTSDCMHRQGEHGSLVRRTPRCGRVLCTNDTKARPSKCDFLEPVARVFCAHLGFSLQLDGVLGSPLQELPPVHLYLSLPPLAPTRPLRNRGRWSRLVGRSCYRSQTPCRLTTRNRPSTPTHGGNVATPSLPSRSSPWASTR